MEISLYQTDGQHDNRIQHPEDGMSGTALHLPFQPCERATSGRKDRFSRRSGALRGTE